MRRTITWLGGALALLLALALALVWLGTFHPAALEPAALACAPGAPALQPGQQLKLMTWNVQYMAGKRFVFFSDLPDGDAPDERPDRAAIEAALAEVARVVRAEAPDILLLQELDDGAARTDYEDQLARLGALLPPGYACQAEAFYWRAAYVPHPRIHGAVGMKLAILSKYQISLAQRHQLALMPADPLSQQFNLKRAVLEARLPIAGGGEFVALGTHLDAFAQGDDTMQRQVAQVDALLASLSAAGRPWAIGGDFNLLPSDAAYARVEASHQLFYNPHTEITPLYARYQTVPSAAEAGGPDAARWYTYYANDPAVGQPDRTLDYLFLAPNVALGAHAVRQHDTLAISDHMPVVAQIRLP